MINRIIYYSLQIHYTMVAKDPLTTINVKTSTRDALYHLKGPAKTYDQIILELLDIAEKKEFINETNRT